MTEELVRTIEWEPAYDRRKANPDGGFTGCAHCMTCRFVLTGPAGVVEFILFTGWWPKAMGNQFADNPEMSFALKALPADVIAHNRVPWDEKDQVGAGACHRLNGKCYTRSWGPLAAERLYETFVVKGDSAVWAVLEGRYVEMRATQPS